jgi:ribosomal protein S18 acetylase RimI-like enzyme
MMQDIAKLHIRALPHTLSSRMGEGFVSFLYYLVSRFGEIREVRRDGKIVGALSMIGPWILTLVVDPSYQHKGIGREMVEELSGRRYVYTEENSRGFYQKLGFKVMCKIGKIIFLWRK